MTKLLQCLHELVRRDYAASTISSYVQIVDAAPGRDNGFAPIQPDNGTLTVVVTRLWPHMRQRQSA